MGDGDPLVSSCFGAGLGSGVSVSRTGEPADAHERPLGCAGSSHAANSSAGMRRCPWLPSRRARSSPARTARLIVIGSHAATSAAARVERSDRRVADGGTVRLVPSCIVAITRFCSGDFARPWTPCGLRVMFGPCRRRRSRAIALFRSGRSTRGRSRPSLTTWRHRKWPARRRAVMPCGSGVCRPCRGIQAVRPSAQTRCGRCSRRNAGAAESTESTSVETLLTTMLGRRYAVPEGTRESGGPWNYGKPWRFTPGSSPRTLYLRPRLWSGR